MIIFKDQIAIVNSTIRVKDHDKVEPMLIFAFLKGRSLSGRAIRYIFFARSQFYLCKTTPSLY